MTRFAILGLFGISSACQTMPGTGGGRGIDAAWDRGTGASPGGEQSGHVDVGMGEHLYVALDQPSRRAKQKRVRVWATHYSVHSAREASRREGRALRNTKNRSLGVRLSRKDWCRAAMQGTVQITRRSGEVETYQFVKTGDYEQVDCRRIFPRHPAIGRSRFRKVNKSRLKGARGAQLIPYRSVAVDRRRFPSGTLLYVPAAKGTAIKLSSGKTWIHDGYFFAADRGGGLRGGHIDVYLGTARKNPFRFVKSRQEAAVVAYVVTDKKLVDDMARLHGVLKDAEDTRLARRALRKRRRPAPQRRS
ncbi:MAG: hypothetical protein IPK13_14045 [Deltaproteobacteria bacterium]|nr:hypothetical protein [Deltaproteobacteria bacterium]